jgi:hypothetical protein
MTQNCLEEARELFQRFLGCITLYVGMDSLVRFCKTDDLKMLILAFSSYRHSRTGFFFCFLSCCCIFHIPALSQRLSANRACSSFTMAQSSSWTPLQKIELSIYIGFISMSINTIFITLPVLTLKMKPLLFHTKHVMDCETKVQSDSLSTIEFSVHQGWHIPNGREA